MNSCIFVRTNAKLLLKLSKRSLIALLSLQLFLVGCAGNVSRTKKVDTVVQTARSYTGTPYKFGGTTRVGIDCSALILHSYGSIGLKMPRVSKDQAKSGVKVRLKELKPGDLVFFATGKKKREVTHAGIVTVVRGKKDIRFIHSSTSLGVTESNLYSPYYLKRFLRARRIL